jgi:hypothetical protein
LCRPDAHTSSERGCTCTRPQQCWKRPWRRRCGQVAKQPSRSRLEHVPAPPAPVRSPASSFSQSKRKLCAEGWRSGGNRRCGYPLQQALTSIRF